MTDFDRTVAKGNIATSIGHEMDYRNITAEEMKGILGEIIKEIESK